MRHGKRNIRFGRQSAHRKATLISLVSSLIRYNRIETTLAKAKEARRLADRIVTWGKRGKLHHRRMVYSLLGKRDLVGIVFKDIAPLFANRQGGYTRVVQTRNRPGDGAKLAILEWTEIKRAEEKLKVKSEEKPKPKAEEKPKAKSVEKPKPGPQEKPKPKAAKAPPRVEPKEKEEKEEQKKKGFLGGLRNLFQKKKQE